jgi:hypothetical protein
MIMLMIMIFLNNIVFPIKDVVGLNIAFIFLQIWGEILKFMKNSKLMLNKVFIIK